MEDEGFVDDEFIEETARDYVGRYAGNAPVLLREHAAIAEASGDYLLTQTWQRIIEAAEDMLGPGSYRRQR
ncbi:MAG TPA: hypothetical protein VNF04_11430 [Stellaceae bacterium]|nr:hypothetical protein [Stellaceae bacterium]